MFNRKPVRVTIFPYSNLSVDNVVRQSVDIGLVTSLISHNFGEIHGSIKPELVKKLRRIEQVQSVTRHRTWVDKLTKIFDPP